MRQAWILALAATLVCGTCRVACAETETVAAASHRTAEHTARTVLHFDYELALTQAAEKKRSGLRKLFWFTGTAVCKGCIREEHSQVLLNMLSLWGDEAFSRELSLEPAALQRVVVGVVDAASTKPPLHSSFPKTYALRTHAR